MIKSSHYFVQFRLDLGPIINKMKLYTRKCILFYADQLLKSTRQMMHSQGNTFDVSYK